MRYGTLAGVAACMLLSFAAMGAIAYFVDTASRKNASALLYESADAELRNLLRRLEDVVLSDAPQASLAEVKNSLSEFQQARHESAALTADTGDVWPELDSRVDALIGKGHKSALRDEAMIEVGGITSAVEKVQVGLGVRAYRERVGAVAAEKRIGSVIIVASILIILGTAGVFVILDRASRKVLGAVRASEARLRQITDAVSAVIVYVDSDRRFQFHNLATELDLGLTSEQIDGRTMREVFGDEAYEELRPWVDQVLAGIPVRFERSTVDALGERRDFGVHYFPRRRGDREGAPVVGYYGLITDISDLKRIDRMKTEFTSTVSHELRTPLTSIRGSLGLLAGGVAGALPRAAEKLVDIAKTNCERLIRLINDILDTEKIESGELRLNLQVADLKPLIVQTLAANEGFAAQHKVKLALLTDRGAMRAHVDTDRVIQVVTNLLSNAIKFSPAGGIVEIALSHGGGRVRVEVRDRGCGIPEEFRARVFQKFSQADSSDQREKGGSGLGLNISKSIVGRLGGTIGFSTETGAGTTFHFELPEWEEPAEAVTRTSTQVPNRPCVLVCDDDADIARLIGMMLDNAGYNTDLAYTATQAREMASAKPYAAITVDLKLPDQDGLALIRALREEPATSDLPVVVLSATAGNSLMQRDNEALRISAWLGKPIDQNRLVLAVRHAVEERAALA